MTSQARILRNHALVARRWFGLRQNVAGVFWLAFVLGFVLFGRTFDLSASPWARPLIWLLLPVGLVQAYVRVTREESAFLEGILEPGRGRRLHFQRAFALGAVAVVLPALWGVAWPRLGALGTASLHLLVVFGASATLVFRDRLAFTHAFSGMRARAPRSGAARKGERPMLTSIQRMPWLFARMLRSLLRERLGSLAGYVGGLLLVLLLGIGLGRQGSSSDVAGYTLLCSHGLLLLAAAGFAVEEDARLLEFDPQLFGRLWRSTFALWSVVLLVQALTAVVVLRCGGCEVAPWSSVLGLAGALTVLAYVVLVRLSFPESELLRTVLLLIVVLPVLLPVAVWICLRRVR